MTLPSSREEPDRPACRRIPDEGLQAGTSSIGQGPPPLWEQLLDAGGRTAMVRAREVMVLYPRTSEGDCVGHALQECAAWVLDLPASERQHHSRPYGLYRHSFEVASFALQDLHERWSQNSGSSIYTRAEQGSWLKVAFLLGLFHDCGKVLDLEVRLSESGPCWDPLQESLAEWKARHGVDPLAPTPHRFRRGRGLHGHEQKGFSLVPVVLAHPRWEALRPPLTAALTALVFRHQEPAEKFQVPLAYLADLVHRADVRSAREDWRTSRREPTLSADRDRIR